MGSKVGVTHALWTAGNPPVLKMANTDDDYYVETFHNWSEVEDFISVMRDEATTAFGTAPEEGIELPPQHRGQAKTMTICEGPDTVPAEVGHWYSPAKVSELLARKLQCQDRVFMICNSYESGYGHGLANDGLDLSKTPHADPELGEAYQLGYECGSNAYLLMVKQVAESRADAQRVRDAEFDSLGPSA